jgi:HlyD family secretion protein
MNRNIWLTSGILVVALLIGGAFLLPHSDKNALPTAQAQAPATPPPSIAVETAPVQRQDVSRLLTLPGTIHPFEEATIAAKIPGYLSEVRVDKGAKVRAGQVVAVIRAPELDAEEQSAREAHAAQLAAAEGSRADYRRSIAEKQRITIGVEKAKAKEQEAEASTRRAKAQQTLAEAAVRQATAQRDKALADREETRALLNRAEAEMLIAKAEADFANATSNRYKGIYEKDKDLIAKQEVEAATSKAKATEEKVVVAKNQIEAIRRRLDAAEALLNSAESQITQAETQVVVAKEQVAIAQAQAQSARKETQFAQAETLIGNQAIAASAAQTRRAELQARATNGAKNRAIAIADYSQLRAPFSGVVTRRVADPGTLLQGQASVLTIARMDTMRLIIYVPEIEARFVRPGSPLALTITSLPGESIKTAVARTTSALDDKNRTLLIEADLPNPKGLLLAGTYATVKLTLETHLNVLSIPTAAINNEKTGKSVFVVNGNKAKRVPVTIGFDDGTNTEIVEGLTGNEEVIVTGKEGITPDASVITSPYTGPRKK